MSRRMMVCVAAVPVLLTACRVDAVVSVEIGTDGAGMLRIEAVADEEFVERATRFGGADPIASFRTADLEQAGWTVIRQPEARRLVLERAFRSPEELAALIAGLDPGSATPVLGDFLVVRRHALFSDGYDFSGRVDLAQGGSAEPIVSLLQGLDPSAVDRIAGADLDRAFHLALRVRVPGEVETTNAPTREDGAFVWPVEPGAAVRAEVSTSQRDWLAVLTAAGAVVLVLITILLSLAVASAARRRRRPSRPEPTSR